MELWIGALNLGFLYAFMTMGVFITFRIHDFPDITVDGSFTAGAAGAAVVIVAGAHPLLSLPASFLIGAAAGCATAVIHTRLRINGLLAGILVMTGLYSINLHVMGRSNIPLLKQKTLITGLADLNPGLPPEVWTCLALGAAALVFWLAMSFFFRTDLGISMRATGNNAVMTGATGVNVDAMKTFGVALANGFVGVSGGLVAQYQGFADIGMGIGTIVIGLAAVIIGESILRSRSLFVMVLSVIIGSVLFRLMIAVALYVGMNPIDLKLITAGFVLLTLLLSKRFSERKRKTPSAEGAAQPRSLRRPAAALGAVVLLGVAAAALWWPSAHRGGPEEVKIGFVQVSDHGLLNITRDSFVEELGRIGYRRGENCTILLEDANGDLPTVRTILDKFVQEDVDLVVPISTACTQAAVNRIKDRPVVFATVANPFIIGAGDTESDHLPNVTGVYGWVPMDRTMDMVRKILPGRLTVAAIWDPAHANSVFNVGNLKTAVASREGDRFVGATITSSSEVYQAAVSLAQKDIDAFVLSPDNIVYSAFEAVVKASRPEKIPIFMSDVERLPDGALGALGYDYRSSGIQAARLVKRILEGESPKEIPFERYRKLTVGLNLDIARSIGVTFPDPVLASATELFKNGKMIRRGPKKPAEKGKKRLALFLFSEHPLLTEAAEGVMKELRESGILEKHGIAVETQNAQNEFYLAQSIAQDLVRRKVDYIITLSTPALQVTAQVNKTIPHVFGAVTDPYRMGVADDPDHHLPQLTGVATLQPVGATIRVMRELFPAAKRIGLVWNPAEACSEACTEKARQAAAEHGFELEETTVSTTGEVMDAVRSLLNRKIDCFLTSGDNTVLMALETIAAMLEEHRIPYFTNSPSDVDRGAFVSIGADYVEVGRETARMAVRVIRGEKPAAIPIRNFVPEKMGVNAALADRYGIRLSDAFLERAAVIRRTP